MKISWPAFPKKMRTTPSHEEHPPEPVRILAITESKGEVHLRVAMSLEFHNELHDFLVQNGLTCWGNDRKVLPLFVRYGLSEEGREELKSSEENLLQVSSRYAALNVQTSECYAKNSEIARGLHLHLQENRALKRELDEEGLGDYVSEDEWDEWDDSFIDELYRRYVFCK